MTRIQFGFTMPYGARGLAQRLTFVQNLDRALELVAGHFDSAWSIDHLLPDSADQLEGFTLLTYMAARHPHLTFGHTVLSQSFRNPALLAQMGATLHFLSQGRFILGIGAGSSGGADEYRAYGYDFPPGRVRVEQLEETLQIIQGLWTQEQTTFVGRHYRVSDARCEPKPNPLPPIMVGAFGPKMLRVTAKYADWWNVSSTGLAEYRRLVEECERACADVGREPKTLRRSWCGGCACAPTGEEAERFAGGLFALTMPMMTLALLALRSKSLNRCAPSSIWESIISCSTAAGSQT